MTTEIERQFFDTFGIEPKYESHSCDGWGRTVKVKYFTDKKDADKFGMVFDEAKYPQITDTHYLQLVCWVNERRIFQNFDVNGLKEYVLKELCTMVVTEQFKQQVQALFEEG